MELDQIKSELNLMKQQLNKCDEDLIEKEKELKNKALELEKSKKNVEIPVPKTLKNKRYVQTSFFKPIVKKEIVADEHIDKLITLIKEIEINSITPVDAMKKLIELKEYLNKLKS